MYIKIKHLKHFLLFSLCLLLAGFNYFALVKAANPTGDGKAVCDKSLDADCDELTDAEEALYGTNPHEIDSDSDGYSDGVEIKSGYDPMKPAPGDRILTTNTSENMHAAAKNFSTDNSLITNDITNELKTFLATKKGLEISNADVNDFFTNNLEEKIDQLSVVDPLPETTVSQTKILKQAYENLSEKERKEKKLADADKYSTVLQYLLISNAPGVILTTEDLEQFAENFKTNLAAISSTDKSLDYFVDLGNRLALFVEQSNDLEVPETMLGLHTKFITMVKGFSSTLQNFSKLNANDPIARMAAYKQINAHTTLFADFFSTDFQAYFSTLEN